MSRCIAIHCRLSLAKLLPLAALLVLVTACADSPRSKADESDSPPPSTSGLEIAGTYVDEWGATQTITSSSWSDSYGFAFHVLVYYNAQDYLLAQNDTSNASFPDLFSRFDWTTSNSDLYYCQADYDAPDAATAEATVPDRSALTTNGCSGFAWTNLTPPAGP